MIRSIKHRGETIAVHTRATLVAGPQIRMSLAHARLEGLSDEEKQIALIGVYVEFLGGMTDRSSDWWDENSTPTEIFEIGGAVAAGVAEPTERVDLGN